MPQQEIRAHALLCRRFISIPGAMWEGPWGDQFENSIKVEIDKLSKGVDKIVQDYRANRIVPDFRPSGGNSDQDTADTLDGHLPGRQLPFQGPAGATMRSRKPLREGSGAYRLANDYADPDDKDNDEQRVNPGLIDRRCRPAGVFRRQFQALRQVRCEVGVRAHRRQQGSVRGGISGQAERLARIQAERGLRLVHARCRGQGRILRGRGEDEKLLGVHPDCSPAGRALVGRRDDPKEIAELKARGWKMSTKKRAASGSGNTPCPAPRCWRITATSRDRTFPIVPVYGKRWFVDNQERFRGHVSKLMDAQRIYNAKVSKLSETDSLAPREKPIFLAEQMPPSLQDLWKRQEH
jgi:hypothetical protein